MGDIGLTKDSRADVAPGRSLRAVVQSRLSSNTRKKLISGR